MAAGHFTCRVCDLWGRRRQVRRGGFASKAAATRARDTVLAQSCEEATAHLWAMETWLGFWLDPPVPQLDALTAHVAAFGDMLTGRHGERLDAWIAAARPTTCTSTSVGLELHG